MKRTNINKEKVKLLARYLDVNWARVSRSIDGMEPAIRKFSAVRRHGSLSRARLWRIGYLKSPRQSELLKKNDSMVVRDRTQRAFRSNCERERMRLLCELRGVSVPRASSILSWTHPDLWPVIDQRAWRTLWRFKVVQTYENGTGLGPLQWEVFVEAVDELRKQIRCGRLSPQQIDRLLYQEDKDHEARKKRRQAA